MPDATATPSHRKSPRRGPAAAPTRVLARLTAAGFIGLGLLSASLVDTDRALLSGLDRALAERPVTAARAGPTSRGGAPSRAALADTRGAGAATHGFDGMSTVSTAGGAIEVGGIVAFTSRDGRQGEIEIVDVRPLTDVLPVSLGGAGGTTWYVAVGRPLGATVGGDREVRLLIEAVTPEEPRLVPARAL